MPSDAFLRPKNGNLSPTATRLGKCITIDLTTLDNGLLGKAVIKGKISLFERVRISPIKIDFYYLFHVWPHLFCMISGIPPLTLELVPSC